MAVDSGFQIPSEISVERGRGSMFFAALSRNICSKSSVEIYLPRGFGTELQKDPIYILRLSKL
jgi:hypothetical protein